MKIEKKDLVPLLELDFSKYEYYADYLPYRWTNGKTEFFNRESMKWEKTQKFDARKKFETPFEFDIDMFDESHKDQFIEWTLGYVNRK